MRVAWWTVDNTRTDRLTRSAPTKLTMVVLDELVRRGHDFTLTGVPRPDLDAGQPLGRWRDTGKYARRWSNGDEVYLCLSKLVRDVGGGLDAQNRTQRELINWIRSSEWYDLCSLENFNLAVIKAYSTVSMLAKFMTIHEIIRAVSQDLPTVLFDLDYLAPSILSSTEDLIKVAGGNLRGVTPNKLRECLHVFAPYFKRVWKGNQIVTLPPYEPARELPIVDGPVEFALGYVGNDYGREAALMKFYKRNLNDGTLVNNAVWGRWDLNGRHELLDAVGLAPFKGPVPPDQVRRCYQRCRASIAIAHQKFVKIKLIAFRWFEVVEAGRLLFVDSAIRNPLTLIDAKYYVDAPELVHAFVSRVSPREYRNRVEDQRAWFRANPFLSAEYLVDALLQVSIGEYVSSVYRV